MGRHERFKIGLQCRGGCQERNRLTTVKKYILAVHPNYSVNFLSFFVDKPSALCHPEFHVKPPRVGGEGPLSLWKPSGPPCEGIIGAWESFCKKCTVAESWQELPGVYGNFTKEGHFLEVV